MAVGDGVYAELHPQQMMSGAAHLPLPHGAAIECVQSADFDAEGEQQGGGMLEEERGENHPARLAAGRYRASGAVSGGSAPQRGGGAGSAAAATVHQPEAAGAAFSSAMGAAAAAPLRPRKTTSGDDNDGRQSTANLGTGGSIGGEGAGGHWAPDLGQVLGGGGAAAPASSHLAGHPGVGAGQQHWHSYSGLAASMSGAVPQVTEVHGQFPPPVSATAAAQQATAASDALGADSYGQAMQVIK